MKTNSKLIVAGVTLAALGAIAYTQLPLDQSGSMAGMDHSKMTSTDASGSTKGFEAAMAVMMKGMMTTPTGKPDLDFAQGMIPHHQGAIDMAKVVLQFGKDAEIRTLAEGVVKAQESEIAVMKDWLAKTDTAALPSSPESVKGNTDAMAAMMKDMMAPYTGDADVDFVKGMIPHHQGAIDMAKVMTQFGKDPVMLKLASEVTAAQESEIAFMKSWLAKMGK